MDISIKSWQEAEKEAFSVRREVFIVEQGVPEHLELDEFDPQALHTLVHQGKRCIATARLVNLGNGQAQIGRMAVLAAFRGQGIGQQILIRLIELAKSQQVATLILHAQKSAIPFYEKLGFIAEGPIYDEAGIPHRNMMLTLSKSA